VALGIGVALCVGPLGALFLAGLDWATEARLAHPILIALLPLAGAVIAWAYHRYAGAAARGTPLAIDALREGSVIRVPRRTAPLIVLGTIWTHLFGGSAGREGTAVQLGAGIATAAADALHVSAEDRGAVMLAGVSAGFAAVFGTPAAAILFGLEAPRNASTHFDQRLGAVVAAFGADVIARLLGARHTAFPRLPDLPLDAMLLAKVALFGLSCGLLASAFILLLTLSKRAFARIDAPPVRAFVGGALVLAVATVFDARDHLGLSVPLALAALEGGSPPAYAFALKLGLTVLTLASGFVGGEVTPLFVIGATFGHALGAPLGVDPTLLAAIGFVGVFAGASRAPWTCAVMGIELFGVGGAPYLLLACVIAALSARGKGLYSAH
jgi:H+/Cl- antiporter ClcA